MLTHIDRNAYHLLRPLAANHHLALIIDATIAHPLPAMVWVDDPASPRAAFIWDQAYSYYFLGAQASGEIGDLLRDVVFPQARAAGRRFVKLHITPGEWNTALSNVQSDLSLHTQDWRFYRYDASTPPASAPLPPGYRLQPIDAALLRDPTLEHRDNLVGELWQMWRNPDDFLAIGFGAVVLHEHSLACWCTAEYLSDGKYGIGIETIEPYQQQGLATAAAAAVVREGISRGLTPHWDCRTDNLPSNRVAEKVGFRLLETYAIYNGRI